MKLTNKQSRMLKKRIIELNEEGLSRTRIANELGCNFNKVTEVLQEAGLEFNVSKFDGSKTKKLEKETLRKYCDEGYLSKEIAEIYGVNPHTVMKWIQGYGLKINNRAYQKRYKERRKMQKRQREQGPQGHGRCRRYKSCKYGTQSSLQRCDYYLITGKHRRYECGCCLEYEKGPKPKPKALSLSAIDPHAVRLAMKER